MFSLILVGVLVLSAKATEDCARGEEGSIGCPCLWRKTSVVSEYPTCYPSGVCQQVENSNLTKRSGNQTMNNNGTLICVDGNCEICQNLLVAVNLTESAKSQCAASMRVLDCAHNLGCDQVVKKGLQRCQQVRGCICDLVQLAACHKCLSDREDCYQREFSYGESRACQCREDYVTCLVKNECNPDSVYSEPKARQDCEYFKCHDCTGGRRNQTVPISTPAGNMTMMGNSTDGGNSTAAGNSTDSGGNATHVNPEPSGSNDAAVLIVTLVVIVFFFGGFMTFMHCQAKRGSRSSGYSLLVQEAEGEPFLTKGDDDDDDFGDSEGMIPPVPDPPIGLLGDDDEV